jgi:type II secretion system protein J
MKLPRQNPPAAHVVPGPPPPVPRRTRGQQAGVTLLEILIAITILMMVVAAIYSTWTSILKATRVGLDAAAAAQRERLTMEVLEQALAYAQMYVANGKWYWFEAENGDDARISFVTRPPKAFPRGGKFGEFDLRRVEFALRPGEGGQKDLILRQAPLLMDYDEDEMEHPLVLARNVKDLEFSFYDPQKNDWLDEWANTNKVPQVVLVKLTLGTSKTYSTSADQTREVARVITVHGMGVQPQHQRGGMGLPGQPGMPIPGQPGVVPPPGIVPGTPVPGQPRPLGEVY